MNKDLAPTYQRLFGHYWVLWYSKSNNYSVVTPEFKELLDHYIKTNSVDEFTQVLSTIESTSNAIEISKALESYLLNCNKEVNQSDATKVKFNTSELSISKLYLIKGKYVQINFDSDLVKNTIHPSLAHLEIKQKSEVEMSFDVFLDNDRLYLFKDKTLIISVPKRDYHLIQGKFIFQLISSIHNKKESDWLGTLHGSTITDGKNAILLIGNSGKGKSTLSALLAANNFDLLADDVSPILSENHHIYHNPSAISLKEGSFKVLRPLINDFDNIPTTVFNKSKGKLKYVPFPNSKEDHYPCKTIIMVNYDKNSGTKLEPVSIKTLLEVLITESWLSPNPINARQFLNWLESVSTYQLTYSDNSSVTKLFSNLFNKINNN